ncbi:MAG: MBL fold metallo-hydrolase [Balneolaceae bacterium]
MKPTAAALYEGTFSVGLDKRFNPIARDEPPARQSLKLSINPFLIQTGSRNILFDTGLGSFGENTSTNTLLENLQKHGLAEGDITDIFMSHLHIDHLGGLAGRDSGFWELTFPDAILRVSGEEWEKLTNAESTPDNETRLEFLYFLESRMEIEAVADGEKPIPEVTIQTIGGHTEYSLALHFHSDGVRFLMAGDVIGTKGAINRTYAAKYDYDPQQSTRMRKELADLALKEGYAIMAYHETDSPIFRVTDYTEGKGYRTEPWTA